MKCRKLTKGSRTSRYECARLCARDRMTAEKTVTVTSEMTVVISWRHMP